MTKVPRTWDAYPWGTASEKNRLGGSALFP
jgi:hypothetical protein